MCTPQAPDADPIACSIEVSLQVAEASQQLIQLQQLLGSQGDVDIVWMLTREPGYSS